MVKRLKNFSNQWPTPVGIALYSHAAPSSVQKLCTPLATILVEKNFEKIFGVVNESFELPNKRNFRYLEKNCILKFFGRVRNPWLRLQTLS